MENIFAIKAEVDDRTYVDRSNLDDLVRESLDLKSHVIVYGPSKSGKTWLRKTALANRDTMLIQCRSGQTISSIYTMIRDDIQSSYVSAANYSSSNTEAISASTETHAEVGGLFGALISIGAKFGVVASSEETKDETVSRVFREPSVREPGFIAELLKVSGKQVVVEDVHYLAPEVQRELSTDLKAFWELQVPWVLVSTYAHASGLMSTLNSDLGERSTDIHLTWKAGDLNRLIENAESHSSWTIESGVSGQAIDNSFGNVGILVSLMRRALRNAIKRSAGARVQISLCDLEDAKGELVGEYWKYVEPLCSQFVKGRRERSETELTTPTKAYGAILLCLLSGDPDRVHRGIHSKRIEEFHPNGAPQYTRILKGIADYQLVHMPGVMSSAAGRMMIAYDHPTRTVSVVDPELLFLSKNSDLKEDVAESVGLEVK